MMSVLHSAENGRHITLCADGWSTVRMEGVIGIAAVPPSRTPYLFDAMDAPGMAHTGKNMAGERLQLCVHATLGGFE